MDLLYYSYISGYIWFYLNAEMSRIIRYGWYIFVRGLDRREYMILLYVWGGIMIYREKGVYDIVICMRGHYSRVPTLLRSGAYPRRLSLPRPDGASVGLLTVVLHLIRGRRRPSLYFLYNVSRRYIKNLGRNRHSLALIGVYLFCFVGASPRCFPVSHEIYVHMRLYMVSWMWCYVPLGAGQDSA